ncbi:MAG: hypothetical protein ACHQQS_17930 [Thermoanaerobaculales bacterium]
MTQQWVASVAAFLALLVAMPSPCSAQDCSTRPSIGDGRSGSWVPAFAEWCRACGGTFDSSTQSCIPGSNWGGTGGQSGSGGLGSGELFGPIITNILRALFGSDHATEARQQAMMEELERQRIEAERQHKVEEARRLSEILARLGRTLKLNGLPDLQLKKSWSGVDGLQLKLGDSTDEHIGRGLPCLPGVYLDGPRGQCGSEKETGLKLKIGEEGPGTTPPAPGPATPGNQHAEAAPVTGTREVATAPQDPRAMATQQAAEVMEIVSRLSPEEQRRLLAILQSPTPAVPPNTQAAVPASAPIELQQQEQASRAAAAAPTIEDASARARVGFDTPTAPVVDLRPLDARTPHTASPETVKGTATIPSSPPVEATATSQPGASAAPAPHPPGAMSAAPQGVTQVPANDDVRQFLFPGPASMPPTTDPGGISTRRATADSRRPGVGAGTTDPLIKEFLFPGEKSVTPFPTNPEPPLVNPLRTEADLKAELKRWDDWAAHKALHVADQDTLFADQLKTEVIREYSPDLLGRFKDDATFKGEMIVRLNMAAQLAAMDYYQALASAHKVAILTYHRGIDDLQHKDLLLIGVPLDEQFTKHPELRGIVQTIRDRAAAVETQSVQQAEEAGHRRLDEEYRRVFDIVRTESAQNFREK